MPILLPQRTRFGDDYLRDRYVNHGCRQLVMLGAGMDARAYRMPDLPELHIYEIDKQDNFNVKEPLLKDEPLTVASRHPVAAEFEGNDGQWARDLIASGFDPERPTVWLLEGLVMYLNIPDTIELFKEIGQLSSKGSVVFHDACSARYMSAGIVVGGAKFIGGSDEYGRLWATHGGFNRSFVHDFKSVRVDRRQRRVVVDERQGEATPQSIRGRDVVLFVQAEKA